MHTVFGLHALDPAWPDATVCIGVFDGVHRGHQAVIRAACEDARSHGRPSIVLTFDRHPMAVLRPEMCPPTVLAPPLKLEKLEQLGADVTVIAVFDREFSQQSPQEFLDNVLLQRLNAAAVVVGHDFAFGKGRAGDAAWLCERIPTTVVQPLEHERRRVSSTEIRKDVAEGRVAEAAKLLGSPFAVASIAVRGQGLGRTLGIPTANLVPMVPQVLPAHGIYAGRAHLGARGLAPKHLCAIAAGERPTIAGAGYALEAHLIDFPDVDLYGTAITIEFAARLRDELRFETRDELVQQMRRDIEDARRVLEVSNA